MKQLDKKRLRATINEIAKNRRDWNPPALTIPWSPSTSTDPELRARYMSELDAYYKFVRDNSAERATLLCALMAHSRGHLHIVKQWEPTHLSDGSQKLVSKTLEDQERLVAKVAEEFAMTDAQLAERASRRAAYEFQLQAATARVNSGDGLSGAGCG